jgi:hypothetical protein
MGLAELGMVVSDLGGHCFAAERLGFKVGCFPESIHPSPTRFQLHSERYLYTTLHGIERSCRDPSSTAPLRVL